MKKTALSIFILLAVVSVNAQTKKIPAPVKVESAAPVVNQKLAAFFTISEWEAKLQWLQICSEIMRKSSLPGNVISQYQDSITTFTNDIISQLRPQIQVDTTKQKK